MTGTPAKMSDAAAIEKALSDEVDQGELVAASVAPIMQHLLARHGDGLFSEETVARVGGMIDAIATELLAGDEAGSTDNDTIEAMAHRLAADEILLRYCHVRACEWQLAQALQRRGVVDPVLSPLLQSARASHDSVVANSAERVLTLQTRFDRLGAKMQHSVADLPEAVFGRSDAVASPSQSSPNTALPRASALDEFVAEHLLDAPEALAIEQAGLAIFLTSLETRSGSPRDAIVLCIIARHSLQFAMMLRAAGLERTAIQQQMARFGLGETCLEQLDNISPAQAKATLATAGGAA